MEHYIFSGELTDYSQGISINNRAFRYGDGLFESMYFTYGKIQSVDKHWNRLEAGMKLLKMDFHPKLNKEDLIKQTIELAKSNKIYGAARLRLQVFRKDGGYYLPEHRDSDFVLEALPLENNKYTLNSKGLHIGVAKGMRKNINLFSQLKTTAKQDIILCAIEAEDNGWNDALLLNDSNSLVESSSSNLFVVNNGKVYTPALADGPLNGIMRQNIISACSRAEIECIEAPLKIEDLRNADEIFLSNAIRGIQWVSAFESKRYLHKLSDVLVFEVNKMLGI